MRAIMICVDMHDILSLTLPRQVHHFHSIHVITSTAFYTPTYRVCQDFANVKVLATDLFYADGAHFAKYRALEWGLDQIGREGWLTILDADIIWPALVDMTPYLRRGYLYTPLRRICDPIPREIPPESDWQRYPIHAQFKEWAGYSQTFHCGDVRLGQPPWHEIDFTTAGTGDSLFQAKWPADCKVRPPFECLHLGPHGKNWAGRVTPRVDGSVPENATERYDTLRTLLRKRTNGPDRFVHERIKINAIQEDQPERTSEQDIQSLDS